MDLFTHAQQQRMKSEAPLAAPALFSARYSSKNVNPLICQQRNEAQHIFTTSGPYLWHTSSLPKDVMPAIVAVF
jgi:hypothetical protein